MDGAPSCRVNCNRSRARDIQRKGGTWTVANPPVAGARAKWFDNGNNTSTLYIVESTGVMVIVF